MGRRKKAPEGAHRENIASAAERLFYQKGIVATTMDDIAREAGYSKATLYVYFKNKEEIVGALVLKSMKLLYECLCAAVFGSGSTWEKYHAVCIALTRYQEQFPLYYEFTLGEINVASEMRELLPVERETYEVGERINAQIEGLLRQGIAVGDLRPEIPALQTTFLFWASLSGLILTAAKKQAYITLAMGMTRMQFLEFGFKTLYRSIAKEERL